LIARCPYLERRQLRTGKSGHLTLLSLSKKPLAGKTQRTLPLSLSQVSRAKV
jgi:hypothetical protein